MEKLNEIDQLHTQVLHQGNDHLPTETDPIHGKTRNVYGERGIGHETRENNDEEHKLSVNEDHIDGPPTQESTVPRKRQPNESLFTFNHLSNVWIPIDPKLKLTLKLKNNYALNLRLSKSSVLGIPRCLIFPNSQWNNILLDCYVDFDKILTSYYALKSKYKDTRTIGNLDISLNTGGGNSKSSKEICIYGEWMIMYTRYTRAVLFVYPHWVQELDDYQEYMAGQFGAYPDFADQYKIINLDKAILIRVGQANDLLTDYSQFQDIISYHLINPKTSRPSDAKHPKHFANNETLICRRWNAGHCISNLCSYRHICFKCKGKHQVKECTSGQQTAN